MVKDSDIDNALWKAAKKIGSEYLDGGYTTRLEDTGNGVILHYDNEQIHFFWKRPLPPGQETLEEETPEEDTDETSYRACDNCGEKFLHQKGEDLPGLCPKCKKRVDKNAKQKHLVEPGVGP